MKILSRLLHSLPKEVIYMNKTQELDDGKEFLEDNLSPHKTKPSSLPEDCYYDRLCPGVLYSCNGGSIERYIPRSCPFNGHNCRTTCELYSNGSCDYKRSLVGDRYRSIDNITLFPSSTSHPLIEPLVEKRELVVECSTVEGELHPNVTPSIEKQLLNELEIKNKEDKKYEEICKKIESW